MILAAGFRIMFFFERYGLRDRVTITLNSCLLFLILFCVLSLKFLFAAISGYLFRDSSATWLATAVQVNGRLMLYALGFTAVFMLVGALYWNAWRQRDALAAQRDRAAAYCFFDHRFARLVCIGLLAALTALVLPPSWSVYSALLYLLIAPWKTLGRVYFGRKRARSTNWSPRQRCNFPISRLVVQSFLSCNIFLFSERCSSCIFLPNRLLVSRPGEKCSAQSVATPSLQTPLFARCAAPLLPRPLRPHSVPRRTRRKPLTRAAAAAPSAAVSPHWLPSVTNTYGGILAAPGWRTCSME